MGRPIARGTYWLPASVNEARRVAGLSVATVASASGFSTSHTSAILLQKRRAPPRFMKALADLGLLARAAMRAEALLRELAGADHEP